MKTLHETATAILEEFKRIQTISPNQINEGHPFPIPGIIGVSADGGIYVSHLIDEQISIFARRLLRDWPEIRSTNTQSEWIARVRRAFGPALADIDLDLSFEESAITLVASVCSTVSNTPQVTTPEEHAFGCTLFSHSDSPPIRIGPATIENREDWLTRVEIYRAISKTTSTRLRSAWRGEKLRKRKPSIDSIHENDILRATGSCPYVCSVITDGLSADAAGKRARISARLALTAIALIWQSPTRALNGFNLLIDASAKSQQRITFLPGRHALIPGHRALICPPDLG